MDNGGVLMRPMVKKGIAFFAACVVLGAVALIATTRYDKSGNAAGSSLGAAAVASAPTTALGPATVAVRNAWAAVLNCEYAHGATKVDLGDGSFEVDGLTDDVNRACASLKATAQQAMADPAYINERAALGIVMHDVWNCVQTQGIPVGSDNGIDDHVPEPPGLEKAFAACKKQVEARDGLQDPAALP